MNRHRGETDPSLCRILHTGFRVQLGIILQNLPYECAFREVFPWNVINICVVPKIMGTFLIIGYITAPSI